LSKWRFLLSEHYIYLNFIKEKARAN
jgi:hypothetical protein